MYKPSILYLYITVLLAPAIILFSCTDKRGSRSLDSSDIMEDWHTVFSDDSLVMAYWRDTGNGGTAPDIEARCRFKTEEGKINEEKRPLLSIIYPDEDYWHHEVENIVSLDTEYGKRLYLFFLRAKTGSNEYQHDIVAFSIDGDSLAPTRAFHIGDKNVPHISIGENVMFFRQ